MFSIFKKPLLSKQDQSLIVASIAAAEQRTTGEIRVFIESHCKHDHPIHRSEEIFTSLNMHLTEHRNGVLIYVALKDRKYAIAGDEGINKLVGGNLYWNAAAEKLLGFLRENKIGAGISNCIAEIGASLAEHFPDDHTNPKNELPDEIVFGK